MQNNILRSSKKKVMLHYFFYGKQRSPNDQFDILAAQPEISGNYELHILNQRYFPREIGTIRSIRILREDIQKVKPDVIHISGVKEGFHCMIAAVLAGCKNRILITHGFAGLSPEISGLKKFLFRWVIEPITLMLATSVQCNSQYSYNMQMVRIFARNKRRVIYNYMPPVSVELPCWRNQIDISDDTIVITSVGNMNPGKSFHILTEIIKRYRDDSRLKFVIVGDGITRQEFLDANKAAIAEGRVLSLGSRSHQESMQILSESDIFILPTKMETLGLVFAEASALGIPVIGTKLEPVQEIVKHTETGFLTEYGDVESLCQYLNQLIEDKTLRASMGQAGKSYIHEVLNMKKTSAQIIELYEKKC